MIYPYITYRELINDELGYFICQKEYPHYVCRIADIPKNVFVEAVPVTDHNLFLVFNGVFRGMVIPSYNNVDKEISNVMLDMAAWFYTNRILVEPKKYKKWKI